MRRAIFITFTGGKGVAELMDPLESRIRFKLECVTPKPGVTGIERWTSDGGCEARKQFDGVKVVASGPGFNVGAQKLTDELTKSRLSEDAPQAAAKAAQPEQPKPEQSQESQRKAKRA